MFESINKFKRRILKLNVDSFKTEMLEQLDRFLFSKDIVVDIKKASLKLTRKNMEFNLKIEKKGISYEFKDNYRVISSTYKNYKDSIVIKVREESLENYDLVDKYSYNSKNKEICKVYDKTGIEKFRRETIKVDNYFVHKKTGEVTIHKPDIMENYTENIYKWRVNENYILERHNKKYIYPDGTKAFISIKNSDDFFIRYQLVSSDSKDIPYGGNYYGIDTDIVLKYFQREASINDVIDNFNSKKYIISNSIYL